MPLKGAIFKYSSPGNFDVTQDYFSGMRLRGEAAKTVRQRSLGLLRNTSNKPYGDLLKNQTLSPLSKT